MELKESKVKTAVSKSGLPGLDHTLNPYRGCEHACIYCYSPDVQREARWEQWGDFIDIKTNVPILLSKEKKKLEGVVALSTVTDPYQPIEKERKLTRYCLEQLAMSNCTVSIQTKSDLVLRDIDILKRMKDPEVGFTVTTMDRELARKLEPGASPPEQRVAALQKISDAGIRTWAFLGPIIPTLNDSTESLTEVIRALKDAGCGRILYDKLRLKPIVRKRMERALGKETAKIFRLAASKDWAERIYSEVERICVEVGIVCERAF